MTKNKAFTLIELLVVCIIIGILTSIVALNMRNVNKKTRESQRKSDLTKIAQALDSYKLDNKSYPDTTGTSFVDADSTSLSALIPNYIAIIPVDPKSTSAATVYYRYRADGGTMFKLLAKSETIIASDPDLNKKAGEFKNPVTAQSKCFQISSVPAAASWTDSVAYCN